MLSVVTVFLYSLCGIVGVIASEGDTLLEWVKSQGGMAENIRLQGTPGNFITVATASISKGDTPPSLNKLFL